MKKPHPLLCALGYVWSAPLTLVGLLWLLVYVPRSVRWSEGCLEVVPLWILGNPGAQTWGCIIFYASTEDRDDKVLRVHERVHVVQSFWGGVPIFASLWLLHWLWNAVVVRPKDPSKYPSYLPLTHKGKLLPWWWRAYAIICWERQAYRLDDEFSKGKHPDAWGANP